MKRKSSRLSNLGAYLLAGVPGIPIRGLSITANSVLYQHIRFIPKLCFCLEQSNFFISYDITLWLVGRS
jgi:hypothetical protein